MVKDDYNLDELQQIRVRDLKFNIMPRYLYHYTDKEYEELSLNLLDSLVKKDSVALDIGGHYGIYSLLSARNAKKVYAFEPVPENFKVLQTNIEDNDLTDIITPINKAVSDQQGTVDFNVTWASDSAGFYEHPNAEVIRKISVEMCAIDEELKDVKNVSFIKIDTEGHEIHVLEGLKRTLQQNPEAKLLIEFNPECLENAGTTSRKLINKILSLGYDIFALHEDSRYIVRVTEDVTDEDILLGETYLNLLCLPQGSWQAPLISSHSADIGGAELVLFESLQALPETSKKFILPMVILPGHGPLEEKIKKLPVGMKVIQMHGWVNNVDRLDFTERDTHIDNSNAIAEIAEVFKDFRPQVAMTNTLAVPWTAFVAKTFGVPHLWSIHEFGDLDHGFQFDYGYDTTFRFIDQLSDKILVNSAAVMQHIGKHIPSKKIQTSTLFVHEPVLSDKAPKHVYSSKAQIKLVTSGLITTGKGQLEAVKAVKLLREKGKEAELIILGRTGDPAYMTEIETFCKEHALEKYIHILGFKANPFDYVNMADIFVMCSRNEAFGRVTVEAMLLGKPVVGSDSGGTSELIQDGKNGYLYKPGNVNELVDRIIQLTNSPDNLQVTEHTRNALKEKYQNNYYQMVSDLLFGLKTDPLKAEMRIYQDILSGAADLHRRNQKQALSLTYDIQKFSDEYNKVYAAYNETSRLLEEYDNLPHMKAWSKLKHLKHRLKR